MSFKTGAANIGDAGVKQTVRVDKDLVPEAAVRPSTDNADYHTGRGGAGNEFIVTKKKDESVDGEKDKAVPVAPTGLADRLKAKILGVFRK